MAGRRYTGHIRRARPRSDRQSQASVSVGWVRRNQDSEPVLSLREAAAADHPHLAARDTFVEAHGVRQPAPAPRFARAPATLGGPPPRPGEHTREALADWGIHDVDALLDAGVVTRA